MFALTGVWTQGLFLYHLSHIPFLFAFALHIGSCAFACLTMVFDALTSYFSVVTITVVHHHDLTEHENNLCNSFLIFIYSYVHTLFLPFLPPTFGPLPLPLCFNKGVWSILLHVSGVWVYSFLFCLQFSLDFVLSLALWTLDFVFLNFFIVVAVGVHYDICKSSYNVS
jgi:hypothetical protein